MPFRDYFTYITTNPSKTVLYTGMTNHLEQRIVEHFLNRGNAKTFAGRYYCYQLVYFEKFKKPIHAIEREKEIKDWRRELKIELIESTNADWRFLNQDIMDWPPDFERTSR
ncbi:MAG: GIY-YIG nuclease family protein [Cyclobacteriaceae bacterium]